MEEAVLIIRGLTKRYSNRTVLDRIDLTLENNRVYALVGDAGSGKTTLFRCVGGLCRPDEGEIEILGNPMRDLTFARREVGMLIDQPAFCGDLSVMNNLRLQARILGGVGRERVVSLMKALRITPRQTGHRAVGGCPAGIKLNLAIALALLGGPRLLMLDELCSGLDSDGAELVKRLIEREMSEHGMTVVVSGQFFAELYRMATDFIFMEEGRILLRMTRREIDSRLPPDIRKDSEYEAFYRELVKGARA